MAARFIVLLLAASFDSSDAALQLQQLVSRRTALAGALSAAVPAMLPLRPARANTEADLGGATMEGFDADADKRIKFQQAQKAYKKAWRKQLSELEFATNDEEAITAIRALFKLIQANGNEIPQGVNKQDMDQVYKRVQPKLGKNARMAFGQLDGTVRGIVTVKDSRAEDGL